NYTKLILFYFSSRRRHTRFSRDWSSDVCSSDLCVDQLRRAGAVIVGITNMHELAYGGTGNVSLHGPARNPHDPSRIAGGSSSGRSEERRVGKECIYW